MTRESDASDRFAPDLPALVLQRALSASLAIDHQIDHFERTYRNREDLAGLHVLLRILSICGGAMKQHLIDTSRQLPDSFAPDPNYLPDPSPFSVSEGETQSLDESDDVVVVPLDPDISIQFMDQFELQLGRWLDLLRAPHGRTFDALTGPFRRLARSIPSDRDVELVFRPIPERLYGIWLDFTEGFEEIASYLDEDLAGSLADLPHLLAIEYPLLHEGDTFQHACIGHEIGHVALETPPRGKAQSWAEVLWTEAALEKRGDQADLDYYQWFLELGCDLLGTRLIGPAFGLALTEWTVTQNVWFHTEESSGFQTHPWMPDRLARLAKESNRFMSAKPAKLAEEDSKRWDWAEEILSRWGSVVPPRPAPEVSEQDVIDRALELLDQRASEILGPAEYSPETFAGDLVPVWAKLDAGMAPSEAIFDRGDRQRRQEDAGRWSAPIDWRSILNGGYLHFLADQEHPMQVPTDAARAELVDSQRAAACEHIQGAIELAELQLAMSGLKAELASLESRRR